MPRGLIVASVLLAAGVARAQPAPAPPAAAPPDISDQAIGVQLGVAIGGRSTAGGARVTGHYLYQLSDRDWFDGIAAFTFGGTGAACFRDRSNAFVCEHGLADGDSAEIGATVRRFLAGHGAFWPYLRAGIGVAIVRFPKDDVSGLAIPLHAGGGVRVSVSDELAITGEGELTLGVGFFGHGLGVEPQVGFAVTAGVEFRL